MAIYRPATYVYAHDELPLAPGALFTAEGQVAVSSIVNGQYVVSPSTGAAGERFAGLIKTQTSAANFIESNSVRVVEAVLNGSGSIQLSRVPLAGTLSVYDVAAGTQFASGALSVTAAGLLTVTGGANKSVLITSTYALTVNEHKALYGDITLGGYAGHYVGSVAVVRKGVMFTNMFDTAVNWRAATAVKIAAGGKLTDQSGSGTQLALAEIIALPTAMRPYLGLRFTA